MCSNSIHINEMLKGSTVYDDIENMEVHQVRVLNVITLVHYTYDDTQFIDVWGCIDGRVELAYGGMLPEEPTERYTEDDEVFFTLLTLLLELDKNE